MGSDLPLCKTMQTEGLGGPCPRCGESNCFIKKGSGTWYTFIACPECLFAYGENADSMLEETGGVVSGIDVWTDVIRGFKIYNSETFDEFFYPNKDDMVKVESPFDFSDEPNWSTNVCVISEHSLEMLIEHTEQREP